MQKLLATAAVALLATVATTTAEARNPNHSTTKTRSNLYIAQHTNHVLNKKCLPTFRIGQLGDRGLWIARHRAAHKRKPGVCAPVTPWYVSKQIRVANIIGAESNGDPWPNCPDPYDGGGSWYDTVGCENGGNWLDSPGYYRCGLQFDPGWERRFGRLCP